MWHFDQGILFVFFEIIYFIWTGIVFPHLIFIIHIESDTLMFTLPKVDVSLPNVELNLPKVEYSNII
jgi:hypothetical protein